MKHTIKTIVALLACFAFVPVVAQDISTQGKEFWLSYMHNGFKAHPDGGWVTTQVLISAKHDCTGTIYNPNWTWQEDFSVQANSITTIEIPSYFCYHDANDYEQVTNKGIKIVASDTISVYSTNIAQVSFDASFVLPTESLGDDYIIQTYDQSTRPGSGDYVTANLTSAFLIVATEDGTEIDITPTVKTLGGKPAGQTYSITLNAGQTYQVRSHRSGNNRDLSGTRVTAHDCKKIAVFNGNTLTCIPTNMTNGYDHVYEQAMPLRSWGKNFVVTSSTDRDYDYVKITSAYDDNVITKNGAILTTLDANESYTFKLSAFDLSCFISATQTCAVYLYHESFDDSSQSHFGDPSMVWIAPIEQRINEVTFSTFDHYKINITKHYVNIIVKTEDIGSVYLDDQPIPSSNFLPVNGNSEYSYVSKQISHSVHHLSCDNGFNAHVYGFGEANGYAYMVGSNAIDLNTAILINEEEVKPYETYSSCSANTVDFLARVNFQDYDLLWDFGDGTTSMQNPATHTYDDEQVYPVHLVISTEQAGCTAGESDTTLFYVNIGHEYYSVIDTVACSPFYLGGQLYNDPGYFEHHSTTASGCDSIFELTLDLQYTPNPTDIIPLDTIGSHWMVSATEFQINDYGFKIYDHEPRCVWERVEWSLSDNCNWVLLPSDDQKSCQVYVLGYTSDTIWLSATVYNACSSQQGIKREHWLVCSFYDVEEQTTANADFLVTPNPNNGEMNLNFERLTGKIEVKIYDMNGSLVDHLLTYGGTSRSTMNYMMKRHEPGIYFFVATAKEGTIAKKVVVTQ